MRAVWSALIIFDIFARTHQVQINSRLKKCLKTKSVSVTNGKLEISFSETKLGTIDGKSDPVINIFREGRQNRQFYETVSRIRNGCVAQKSVSRHDSTNMSSRVLKLPE